MLLEEGACKEMMEHFTLMGWIERSSGEHMYDITNEDNEWDQTADTVEGPMERVLREEIMEAFKHLKIDKSSRLSDVHAEMILASGDARIRVLMELCQVILDEKGMPADLATSVAITIFQRKRRYHELWDVQRCKIN